MEHEIEEGRLTETPTTDGGVERRAFGEFISGRGELASYAIGWPGGPDGDVGRISVGIGVGNPGGATFHAVIVPDGASHAYSLVDEPFEDVPQGGPHLTADEARAHDTLEFIWLVADWVTNHDRRALWMLQWLRGTGSIQTPQVLRQEEPVVLVARAPEGERDIWQLIGATDPGDDGQIAHLHHAIDHDPTLCEVLDLPRGWQAERDERGAPWRRLRSLEL